MIEVHERFEVPSDPQTVWGIISSPNEVVNCVPGASLGEQHEDGSYDGKLTVKFGPARVTFNARVTLDLDDAEKTGRMTARGKDTQGGTRMKAAMRFKVAQLDSAGAAGSSVVSDGEVEISGRLAGMIEGGASLVVKRMSSEFANNLEKRCAEYRNEPAPSGT